MNGKKAKMLRRLEEGVNKKTKKMYTSLNHRERGILSKAYSDNKELQPEK